MDKIESKSDTKKDLDIQQAIKQISLSDDKKINLTPKEIIEPKLKKYNSLKRHNNFEKISFYRTKKISIKNSINESANDLAKSVSKIKIVQTLRIKKQKIKYKAHGLKMGLMYKIQKPWAKYLTCVIIGLFAGLISFLLLKNTGTYSSGLGGVSQGIARITQVVLAKKDISDNIVELVYNFMFWCGILVINIPLLIFAYFKVDKRFAIMTSIFILTQNLVGLALSYIPNTENLFIFGLTRDGINIDFSQSGINISTQANLKKALQIVTWTGVGYKTEVGQGARIMSVFAYALVYSLFNGIYLAALYIIGGSSGGTDVIASYISKVKSRSVGTILTYFNITSLIIGVGIGSFSPVLIIGGIKDSGSSLNYISLFFSPNLLASLLGTIIAGLTLNSLFPKHKAVKVQVYSSEVRLIANAMHATSWPHQIAVNQNNDGSLSWISKTNMETVCFYLELPNLIKTIRNVDKDGLILIYPVSDIDGEMVSTIIK